MSFAWCSIPVPVVERRQLYLPSLKQEPSRGAALNCTQICLVRVRHLLACSAALDQAENGVGGGENVLLRFAACVLFDAEAVKVNGPAWTLQGEEKKKKEPGMCSVKYLLKEAFTINMGIWFKRRLLSTAIFASCLCLLGKILTKASEHKVLV